MNGSQPTWRSWLVRGVVSLVVVGALAYPADWALWKARGSAMGSVEVARFVVAPLKGGKEEYYPDGDDTVECSQSLLPQAGAGACWWVLRHKVEFER